MKNKLLYIANFLLLLTISFTFDDSGIYWIWEERIQVPIVLICMAIILIGLSIFSTGNTNHNKIYENNN